MAVLPPVQLLSWSSARLLALLLNSFCGLFHYLESDSNGTIGTGRENADIDWDTPLGLRLIQENLQTIDRQFQTRGFHPTIFSAIRNLSSQSDLLLKERMEQTRDRDAQFFAKLVPLFMVRDKTEFAEHKLVDERHRWAEREQSDRRKDWEVGGKGTKGRKWIREKAVGLTCLLSSMHPKCQISQECAEYFAAKEKIGTSLTDQLFFMQLINEQFVSKCSSLPNFSSSFSNSSVLTSEKCANVFDELNAWTIRKKKKMAKANADTLALLTEQTFLCGHFGFVQFATPQLLVTLLSWQHPKLGCWTVQKPDPMSGFGIRRAIELDGLRPRRLNTEKNAKKLMAEEMSSREDAFCLPHLSIVAGLALSSVYLRFLFDPGPWPEHSLTDQLVEIDGVLAEDKFHQFPYLEWVRDSLLAGVEANGLRLIRPPSSSWSPDLIAFVFLLFFILILFIIFLHFFGKGEEHFPSALRKKFYPYALKKL